MILSVVVNFVNLHQCNRNGGHFSLLHCSIDFYRFMSVKPFMQVMKDFGIFKLNKAASVKQNSYLSLKRTLIDMWVRTIDFTIPKIKFYETFDVGVFRQYFQNLLWQVWIVYGQSYECRGSIQSHPCRKTIFLTDCQ